jgi:hypothetical protein
VRPLIHIGTLLFMVLNSGFDYPPMVCDTEDTARLDFRGAS